MRYNINNGAKPNWPNTMRGRSLELLVSSFVRKKSFYASTAVAQHHTKLLRRQACSLDSGSNSPSLHWFYNGRPRRGSVPQEILIESLGRYPDGSL